MRAPQVRYVVRGTHGTFLTHGVDVQEDQLKVIPSPAGIVQDEAYGVEPEEIWGTVENVGPDGEVVKSECVSVSISVSISLSLSVFVSPPRLVLFGLR